MSSKNLKLNKEFYFKDKSNQEIINEINEKYQVTAHFQKEIIDRIYVRYPIIPREEIETIVSGILKTIRDCLISGDIITIKGLFLDARIDFSVMKNNYGTVCKTLVKVKTPPAMRTK